MSESVLEQDQSVLNQDRGGAGAIDGRSGRRIRRAQGGRVERDATATVTTRSTSIGSS